MSSQNDEMQYVAAMRAPAENIAVWNLADTNDNMSTRYQRLHEIWDARKWMHDLYNIRERTKAVKRESG